MRKNFVSLLIGFLVGLFTFFSDRTADIISSVAQTVAPLELNAWSYFLVSLVILSPIFWVLSFTVVRFKKNIAEKSLKKMFLMNLAGFACAYLAFLAVALIATSQFSISL